MKTRLKRVIQWLALFLCIISGSLAFTINFTPLYWVNLKVLHLNKIVGMSEAQVMKNYHELMHFLNFPWISKMELSDFPSSYDGAQHFKDVKQLFLLDYGIFIVTVVISFFFLRKLIREKKRWILIRPFQWGMVIPFLLLGLSAVNFDRMFIIFHKIFFMNKDNWLFDYQLDPIINVLPEGFFMQCFLLIILLIETCFFLGIHYGKKDLKI